ncbi:DUF2752 domain-containing protein [Pyxidicoccus fallax]|uniref:DUF2752 domain-containing protein n=1 Tax=Pyxidicoccus fallax TaxID=394095 RepID=A0A848L9X6_9BACT|nr:DUF2752 domain-containing protein [Pyxidicoccus fallax]NMO15850.1 DUF2752 domain-containing protein [Pyxidicoccus fallax]NPC79669.1 DUF2752 domain-containing protein [Pyxidicoccus fallax]
MKVLIPPRNRRLGTVDVLGIIGVVGLLVARYIPVARIIPFWGCVLREQTGWPCLGCGLTRVADRVSHLNFAGAWDANPLGTVGAIVFALLAVAMVLHLVFAMPIPEIILSPWEWGVLRVTLPVLILVNYAWVVVKTRFPHLLL